MTSMTGLVPLFPPDNIPIIVMQGSRYRLITNVICDWEADIVGWAGKMVVAADRTEGATVLADLSAYVTILGLPANQVIIDIPADAPELLEVDWTEGVYDVSIEPSGQPARALRPVGGSFRLNLGVAT